MSGSLCLFPVTHGLFLLSPYLPLRFLTFSGRRLIVRRHFFPGSSLLSLPAIRTATSKRQSRIVGRKKLNVIFFFNNQACHGLLTELLADRLLPYVSPVIAAHPSYDRSLWLFKQSNPLRRVCQRLVEPPKGQRLYGVKPYQTWAAVFKLVILCAIAGSVAIAAVATPVYRRQVGGQTDLFLGGP